LASIVLGNIYSGIYTSILAVPRFKVTITSIEDVAANPNIKLHVFKDTPTDNYVRVNIALYIYLIGFLRKHNFLFIYYAIQN